ncbi:RING-H2 finger protein ATL22-like [Hibiscus syriacus]|uniref:RING-H2 finger protein ATL22-like n=1 Tax=Hibiscus syriacus TaxID=106335 RepID=UPI001922C5FC|nr:RING-H2 finger protein ATL22-like [Hibiscus syriacus]
MSLIETFFSIFLMLTLQPSTSIEFCDVLCGIQPIHFPFRLNTQPSRCGYHRFNLTCKNETQSTLTLPFSGDFTVVNIDYIFQNIRINDPGHCTPKRLLQGLNLSGTPFELLHPRSYTVFNCSSASPTALKLTEARFISCLSGTNSSVVAVPTERLDSSTSLTASCAEMAKVLAPLSWTGWLEHGEGIMLTWKEPDCRLCESRAGTCTFKSDRGMDVGCSGGFSNGLSIEAKFGIMFGVGIPLSLILGLLIHLKVDHRRNDQNPNPEASSVVKGLDGQTIDSYLMTLLGESRRLARQSDNTCSICLCEYRAKETLRTIPVSLAGGNRQPMPPYSVPITAAGHRSRWPEFTNTKRRSKRPKDPGSAAERLEATLPRGCSGILEAVGDH